MGVVPQLVGKEQRHLPAGGEHGVLEVKGDEVLEGMVPHLAALKAHARQPLQIRFRRHLPGVGDGSLCYNHAGGAIGTAAAGLRQGKGGGQIHPLRVGDHYAEVEGHGVPHRLLKDGLAAVALTGEVQRLSGGRDGLRRQLAQVQIIGQGVVGVQLDLGLVPTVGGHGDGVRCRFLPAGCQGTQEEETEQKRENASHGKLLSGGMEGGRPGRSSGVAMPSASAHSRRWR